MHVGVLIHEEVIDRFNIQSLSHRARHIDVARRRTNLVFPSDVQHCATFASCLEDIQDR